MAGIYIHIPFCKTRCHYCDFFSCINQDDISPVIAAIIKEIELRKEYLGEEIIETIYFGGGTPSFVSVKYIDQLLKAIYTFFPVVKFPEITLEINPDDITNTLVKSYLKMGINRISMGVQSFDDNILEFLGRRHNSQQAIKTIKILQNTGFKNISLDLIYGIPELTQNTWNKTIDQATEFEIQHISAYHLTIEKGTVLYQQLTNNIISIISDEDSQIQYQLLSEKLNKSGFIHYEISNFSKPGFESKHNSSYWSGKKYAGFGPSAHSFNNHSRQWNVSNNNQYIDRIKAGCFYFKKENLTQKKIYNEHVLTRLRTNRGINLNELSILFGDEYLQYFLSLIKRHLAQNNLIHINKDQIIIPEKSWFISDRIISDLLKV
jgi:oxygen-independent coproporphyrinogen III oxidase